MRKKELSSDGLTIWISPLTFDQADEFLKDPADGDYVKHGRLMMCNGLNNYIKVHSPEGTPLWTPQRINAELDPWLIMYITDEIMAYSGLVRAKKKDAENDGKTSSGEAAAAPAN